jgi:hypothetical protein
MCLPGRKPNSGRASRMPAARTHPPRHERPPAPTTAEPRMWPCPPGSRDIPRRRRHSVRLVRLNPFRPTVHLRQVGVLPVCRFPSRDQSRWNRHDTDRIHEKAGGSGSGASLSVRSQTAGSSATARRHRSIASARVQPRPRVNVTSPLGSIQSSHHNARPSIRSPGPNRVLCKSDCCMRRCASARWSLGEPDAIRRCRSIRSSWSTSYSTTVVTPSASSACSWSLPITAVEVM